MAVVNSEVVILSKTKMSGNNICVGAYDVLNKIMLRLLSDRAGALNVNYPYEIGQAYEITYEGRYKLDRPHTEDVAVYAFKGIPPTPAHDLDELTAELSIICPDLTSIFDGKLCWENGSGFIEEQDNIGYSVQIVRLECPLHKEGDYYVEKRFGISIRKVKYVGFLGIGNMPQSIPGGTKIRFSLARLWDKNEDGNRRAYLQLSGIY